jgi:hypothetical protein
MGFLLSLSIKTGFVFLFCIFTNAKVRIILPFALLESVGAVEKPETA